MGSGALSALLAIQIIAGQVWSESFLGGRAWAKPLSALELSPRVRLELGADLDAQAAPLPSHRGFVIQGRFKGESFTVWTSRRAPETWVNEFSVRRLWKDGLEQVKAMGESTQDLGCRPFATRAFRCDRTGQAGKSKVAEAIIWFGKSDLVVLRASTEGSLERAREILDSIRVRGEGP